MSAGNQLRTAAFFLAPALAVIAVFFLLPVVAGVLLSFTDVDIYAIGDPAEVRLVGLANYALKLLGLKPQKWIFDAATVIPSLALVDVWQWTPMVTLIVLAGLAAIPGEPYESAHVDGANEAQILWHVTIPMVLPTVFTAMVLRSVDALKTFDIIYAMTGGGPGYASETLNVMGFKYSFEYFRLGQASVILVFLFIVVLAVSLGIVRLRVRTQS